MATPLPAAFADRVSVTPMGMHSGLGATLISPQQLSFAVNVTCRGGYPGTRPPFRKQILSYENEDVQTRATQALFQGAAFYQGLGNNPNCLVASIGGRLFRYLINGSKVAVQEITPLKADGVTADVNDPALPQAWMAQGQDFLVVNDGQSLPFFFDGEGVRRSRGYSGQELPEGRQIHYCNGRFIEVTTNGIGFIASDLVYNTLSGTVNYNYRDSILRITDNVTILNGQAFGTPVNAGPITSLFSVAIPDTSLGQGPLQVGTSNSIFSVNLPLDATLWTTTQQPTSVVSLPSGGPTGAYAVTTVNGDAWYRSADGLRSFVTARRDFNTWVQTPLSFEMQRILPFDTQGLLPFASCVTFNNRLLVTCSPYSQRGRGVAHRGLIALDFNNISSITTRSQPAYDGVWTGLPILQVVKGLFAGVERCFLFALDAANAITLYELGYDDTAPFDYNGTDEVGIESSIETGAFFGRESDSTGVAQPLKKLITADYFLQELGSVTGTPGVVTTSYKSDQSPCWSEWASWEFCAPLCSVPVDCSQPVPAQMQYATYKRLPEPPDVCNPLTDRQTRLGYYFTFKLAWQGHAMLKQFLAFAKSAPETANVQCGSAAECQLLQCCMDDPFTYSIEPD